MSLEVINKAREQITKESLKIGGPLANFTEEAAKLITAEGKSIKDLISKITSEARKNAKSNVGCISDEEVIQMIDEYYGIHSGSFETIDILDLL